MSNPHAPLTRKTSPLGNLLRGALIGVVETVPGVSGGTVALVVGVYFHLIDSASHLITAVRRLLLGPDRMAGAREELSQVHWRVIIPLGIGMVAAVFSVAGPMADLVENHPVMTKSLFFGMVLASVAVPLRMALADLRHRYAAEADHVRSELSLLRPRHVVAGVVAAVATFILVSFPPTSVEAHPLIIIPAAAVAVSALVLPGLSGSFLLLTFGLYEPTLRAVDELNFGYLALFMLGLLIGLAVVVKVLRWLLTHHGGMTLFILTGLMIGGLRALWPWQDDMRTLHAPSEGLGMAIVLALVGFAIVAATLVLDNYFVKRQQDSPELSNN